MKRFREYVPGLSSTVQAGVTFVTVEERRRSDICKNYQYEHF